MTNNNSSSTTDWLCLNEVSTDTVFAPESVSNVFEKIFELSLLDDNYCCWRGQANSEWPIMSSIQRFMERNRRDDWTNEQSVKKVESEIIRRCKEWNIEDSNKMTDLELMACLQHYGCPTRLVDVSLNPFVALWFACASDGQYDDKDGVLFMFTTDKNLLYYANEDRKQSESDPFDEEASISWLLQEALGESSSKNIPALLIPKLQDKRINAQSARFLFGESKSDDDMPIYSFPINMSDNALKVIVIRSKLKEKILNTLKHKFGIRRRELFPDFTGFSDPLSKYGDVLIKGIDFGGLEIKNDK